MLLSYGPETMPEDEETIAKGYRQGQYYALAATAAPLVGAYYLDTKGVIAIGLSVALVLLNDMGSRLYDLCIRLRRTNILIKERNDID